jgi:2-oxoglutarate dehydrogenase complex dehydrogenase (E1) component-like enzyme
MKYATKSITTNTAISKINNITLNEETISIFVPMEIKKRGGTAMIIIPKNTDKNTNIEDTSKYFDDKLIKSIAKAYKWKTMLDGTLGEEKASVKIKVSSMAEIARIEKLSPAYVSKLFNLNFLSPNIIERVLSGTQPRNLKLQDIITDEIPDLWQEQEKKWSFYKARLEFFNKLIFSLKLKNSII